ncbi:MAG: hypothetical protein Q9163_005614 [Psora crenata]
MAQHTHNISDLVKAVMRHAPEIMHHIYALEGANEVLLDLDNEESKVAYLIRATAMVLHKSSIAIDPLKVSPGPNDISFHINRAGNLVNFPYGVTLMALGELEDLYYATWAKTKDLLNRAETLLDNGFKAPSDDYFEYASIPLAALGPIKLGDFKACLIAQQVLLQGEQLKTLLGQGIMAKNTLANREQSGLVTVIDHVIQQNYHAHIPTYPNRANSSPPHNSLRGISDRIEGFSDITNMSSGMIFAQLAEKYRDVYNDSPQERNPLLIPEAYRGTSGAKHAPEYVSPYNLDERAKKLRAPGGPEMPCICDRDCICAPLCASDPNQNCLCEENGLFVRVTEGMDIDDLDVPDLVRQSRHSWTSSTGSKSSAHQAAAENIPSWDDVLSAWDTAIKPINGQDLALEDTRNQQPEQIAQAACDSSSSDVISSFGDQFDNILSSGFLTSSTSATCQYWGNVQILPPRSSSNAYHEALTRPFSKECDTPPKRPSTRSIVARRLFNHATISKGDGSLATKNPVSSVKARSMTLARLRTKALTEISVSSSRHAFRQD